MSVKIIPKEFDRKPHINACERYILRNGEKNFKDGYLVVGITACALSTEQVHVGMYISPKEGLITFSIYPGKIDPDKVSMYINIAQYCENEIHERLLGSKVLIVRQEDKKILKFPYKHILIFPEEDIPVKGCDDDTLLEFSPYSAIRFFNPVSVKNRPKYLKDLHIFSNIRIPYDSGFIEINEVERIAIFERLAPEYTITLNEKMDIEIPETEDDIPAESETIDGNEADYKMFELDDYQVSQVNDMGRGHRVILANAGAGKSVLLLSKAIKYSSMYKNSNILLTCYNNNLADAYLKKRNNAGITSATERKLYVYTFHKLVAKLFKDCIGREINSYATDEQVQECISLIKSNIIKTRFKAIFIDEVQIFTPEYLELCYLLLEKKDDALFLMAGDLNQTVRSQSRRGDAPWKKIAEGKLDFTGRVRYIEKNYRNSPEISEFLNRILTYMNGYFSKFKMINIDEFSYDSFEEGISKSVALKVIAGINRYSIQKEIINAIEEITKNHNIPYSDIAILYPMKEHRVFKYNIQYWIIKALENDNIPYSIISSSDDRQKVSYSRANGMIVSSIDSSLGLDFRAVILTGLYPFSFVFNSNGRYKPLKGWNTLKSLDDDEKETAQIQMRKIYTACSRAREVLYVVSDAEENSIIDDIIRNGVKG